MIATNKLYYSPVANYGAASFMAAYIGGVDMTCETVDILERKTASGHDFTQVCKGAPLPALSTTGGVVLTEETVILDYIAGKAFKSIAPSARSKKYYQMHEIMEIVHSKLMGPLHYINAPLVHEDIKVHYRTVIAEGLGDLDLKFSDYRQYAVGDQLTVADCYLLAALDACEAATIETATTYPHIKEYYERVSKVDIVSEAKTKMLTSPPNTRGDAVSACRCW